MIAIASALRFLAFLGAAAALVTAGALLWAGVYEMANGRNVPGFLGRGYFPRQGKTHADAWDARRWRRNGYTVVAIGLNFVFLALLLFLWAMQARR